MATGIVSVALRPTGDETPSLVFLRLGCLAWPAPAADFWARLVWRRRRWPADAGTPGSLTAAAATTVLGTRLSLLGRQTLAEEFLAMAVLLWPVLLTRWG